MNVKCKLSFVTMLSSIFVAGMQAATTTDPAWTEGESVTIAQGDQVILTASTPRLDLLTINGTLVCSNWTTMVSADTVHIGSTGKATCYGDFKANTMSNRVAITCIDLTIDAGGKIDVDDMGYFISGVYSGAANGPGIRRKGIRQGASHGGFGGRAPHGYSRVLTCDDPLEPVQPGSSGDSNDNWGTAGHGGGAVWIEASGRVTLNGSILASAVKGGSSRSSLVSRGTAGAGGSIRIKCDTFASATGVLKADGGSSAVTVKTNFSGEDYAKGPTGGGGMIAVKYNTEHQTADLVTGLTVSAAGGYYKDGLGDDLSHMDADLGTVFFPDNLLLPVMLGKSLSGKWWNGQSYTCDNLEFHSGRVRFCGEGVSLSITGDLSVTGKYSRLEVGGVATTNSLVWTSMRAGNSPVKLTVGGNITLAKGGTLDLRAAATNGNGHAGFTLSAANIYVMTNGTLYATSDGVNLGSPEILVSGAFTVEQGGLVSAYMRGCGCYGVSSDSTEHAWYKGYGPGAGIKGTGMGGGHGGWCSARLCDYGYSSPSGYGGLSYDDEWHPALPGSGSDSGQYGRPGYGGGIIDVKARKIEINGVINADGESSIGTRGGGGGSGGTVFLAAKSINVSDTAQITAIGGDDTYNATYAPNTSSGAGGRIAFWSGDLWSDDIPEKRLTRSETPVGACSDISGTVSAAGGISKNPSREMKTSRHGQWNNYGTDGTIRYVSISPKNQFFIFVK